jgi:hypothetical protein
VISRQASPIPACRTEGIPAEITLRWYATPMFYDSPMIEQREPIGAPFVLGGTYVLSPTWTDAPEPEEHDPT